MTDPPSDWGFFVGFDHVGYPPYQAEPPFHG